MKKLSFILVLLFTSSLSSLSYAGESSARIEGVTDFLIERANETYFHIFEHKMKNNTKFSCYFPDTYDYIKEGNLKALIKTRDIWVETLNSDFKTLQVRVGANSINRMVNFNKVAMDATYDYAKLLRYLKVKIGTKQYPLKEIPINANAEVKNIINGFYDDFNVSRDELIEFNKKLNIYGDSCSDSKPTKKLLTDAIDKLKGTYVNIEAWMAHIDKYKSKVSVDLEAIEKDCENDSTLKVCDLNDKVFNELVPKIKASLEKPVAKAVSGILVLNKYIKNISRRDTYTGKVVEAFKVIKEEKLENNQELKRLKHYALFIAQVADADESSQVEGLLKEYALPVTSYLTKREPGETSFMVTSYFGYSGGKVLNEDDIPSENTNGFYVPVGFEYNKGLDGGSSLSFMLSPVDFGYPVSLKLNGEVDDVEFEDIIAPSFSIAYGIKDYPINLGLTFQKGRKFSVQNKEEKRIMFFVAFDMPLFSF